MARFTLVILIAVGFVTGSATASLGLVGNAGATHCSTGDRGTCLYDGSTENLDALVNGDPDDCSCTEFVTDGVTFSNESDWETPLPTSCNLGGPFIIFANFVLKEGDVEFADSCHETSNCENVSVIIAQIGGDNDEIFSLGMWIP